MGALRRRRTLVLLLIPVVLIAACAITLRIMFPAERVQQLAVERVVAATGADVQLRSASLAFWPRLKLVLAEGSITGTGEALRAASGTETSLESYGLELDRLEVDLAIGPLLKKRIETGRIRLVRPRLKIVTEAQADPSATPGSEGGRPGGSSTATGPSAGPVQQLEWELAVAGLEVREGLIEVRQAGGGPTILVEGWRQDVDCPDMASLLAGLLVFQGGATGPEPAPAATLNLESRVARLEISGLPADPTDPEASPPAPMEFEDISLTGVLEVPAPADKLLVRVTSLKWGEIDLQGDATIVPGDVAGQVVTRMTWRSAELDLPSLFEDLRPMMTVPDEQVAAWLESGPVNGGLLSLGGAFEMKMPPPAGWQPEQLLSTMTVDAGLRDGRLALIDPMEGVEAVMEAELSIAGGVVTLNMTEMMLGGGALRGGGTCRIPLPGIPGTFQAKLAGQGDLAALVAAAPDLARLPVAAGAEDQTAEPLHLAGQLTWRLDADGLDPDLLADPVALQEMLNSGRMEGVTLGADVTGLAIGGMLPGPDWKIAGLVFSTDMRTADFKATDVTHPAFEGDLSGHVRTMFPLPVSRVDLQADRIDLDELAQLSAAEEQTAGLTGVRAIPLAVGRVLDVLVSPALAQEPAKASKAPPGELIPPDLHVDFHGRAERVTLQKATYTAVEMAGNLDGRVVDVESLSARRSSGEIVGQGTVDYTTDPWGELTFTAEAREVPAGELLSPWVRDVAAIWNGAVSTTLSGHCSLRDENAVLQSLNIEGDALSTSGNLDLSSWLAEISSVLGQRQDLKVVRYKQFTHHLALRNGRYEIMGLKLDGQDTDWLGDGWIGLDGGIDLRLQVKLPQDFSPDLGNLSFLADTLRGDDGRIVLNLHLSGMARRPKVNLDLTDAKKAAGESLEKDVKKGINSLLDKLKDR